MPIRRFRHETRDKCQGPQFIECATTKLVRCMSGTCGCFDQSVHTPLAVFCEKRGSRRPLAVPNPSTNLALYVVTPERLLNTPRGAIGVGYRRRASCRRSTVQAGPRDSVSSPRRSLQAELEENATSPSSASHTLRLSFPNQAVRERDAGRSTIPRNAIRCRSSEDAESG